MRPWRLLGPLERRTRLCQAWEDGILDARSGCCAPPKQTVIAQRCAIACWMKAWVAASVCTLAPDNKASRQPLMSSLRRVDRSQNDLENCSCKTGVSR